MKSSRILVADDDEIALGAIAEILEEAGYDLVLASSGTQVVKHLSDEVEVALLDLHMPPPDGMECLRHIARHWPAIETIVVTGSLEVPSAVEAMKHGAFDYLTKPVDFEELREIVRRALRQTRLKSENRQLRSVLSVPGVEATFIGDFQPAREVLSRVKKVAAIDSTVLISGESGVGKGLLARLIHSGSPRRDRPFVTVSCTALPRELVEAELFGHEKGAFTGAHERRPGRVEMAEGGTLFLDAVGDMPIDLQPKLLTFLQERTFRRIGGNREAPVDVRVVAATHQDLPALCKEKKFRQDLFFRLNVLPIHCPPLRERRQDIPLLIDYLLGRIGESRGQPVSRLTQEAVQILTGYPWPGNVRELENVLERSTAFAESATLGVEDLPPDVLTSETGSDRQSLAGSKLSEIEKSAILQTLELCNGNKSKAARYLGISEKSIYNKMKRLGLS